LETFTDPKELVNNPHYKAQRQKSLSDLSDEMIDAPIRDLISGFNKFSYCFTMQSCCGHFVYGDQKDRYNFEPLPVSTIIDRVEYRIAYVCFCVENSDLGRGLLEALNKIPSLNPQYIQFCCADWFWRRQVNSYALQVQPERFRHKDSSMLDYTEALRIEEIRNEFFVRLRQLRDRLIGEVTSGQ
jgi:hypothetical protein